MGFDRFSSSSESDGLTLPWMEFLLNVPLILVRLFKKSFSLLMSLLGCIF